MVGVSGVYYVVECLMGCWNINELVGGWFGMGVWVLKVMGFVN